MFYDERGYYISDTELYSNFVVLKANGETDCETYEDYVRECCGKNGTLTKVKCYRYKESKMFKASTDTSENFNTMEELIDECNLDANDILQYLTDWHGLQLLDQDFMENLFEELGIETEEEDEEDE